MTRKLKLGTKGREILSNFTGILEARIEYITGCDQYHIRAKALPNKKPAEYWADEGTIEIIDDTVVDGIEVNEDGPFKYELGAKAKDNASGFVGTIYGRVRYITGVDRYVIKAEALPGKEPENHWINEGDISLIPEPRVEPKSTQGKKNGGPRIVPGNMGC